jgi:hypothetical protein
MGTLLEVIDQRVAAMAEAKCVQRLSITAWVQLILALFLLVPLSGEAITEPTQLGTLFQQQVDRRVPVPAAEQRRYVTLLRRALTESGFEHDAAQYIVLVDRNALVQTAMIFWKSDSGGFAFIGASPASSGQPGRFEHFETPLGAFQHSLDNPDFRAEGTRNEFGVLGYGRKGLRVYDFGWVEAPKGWGDGRQSIMRLQMHSTDLELLEPRLGSTQSKGCIRISASLNRFIDHYGILDAHYERALAAGQPLWVLSPDREPTPWSGQFLVVVDTRRDRRPEWSLTRRS